jgi:hypothetical protein
MDKFWHLYLDLQEIYSLYLPARGSFFPSKIKNVLAVREKYFKLFIIRVGGLAATASTYET